MHIYVYTYVCMYICMDIHVVRWRIENSLHAATTRKSLLVPQPVFASATT